MIAFRTMFLMAGVAILSACAAPERGLQVAASAPGAEQARPHAQPAPQLVKRDPVTYTVHFDHAQAEIKASAMQILYGAVRSARHDKPGVIRIRGFADASGKRDFNVRLAQARAEAVADQLRKLGLGDRIEIVGIEVAPRERGKAKKDPALRRVEVTFDDFAPVSASAPAPDAALDTTLAVDCDSGRGAAEFGSVAPDGHELFRPAVVFGASADRAAGMTPKSPRDGPLATRA